jgi:protein-S-isoprenylcysteine O-methyltransferase Ste14
MEKIRTLFLIVGAAGLIIPALFDFIVNRDPRKAVARQKTAINAAGILGYFILISVLSVLKIGALPRSLIEFEVLAWIGAVLILISSLLNCIGRFQLGKSWSDDIAVFENHHLVTTGVFHYVRHPLFSAIIGLALGIGFLYCNLAVTSLALIVLYPALFFRARAEERVLSAHLPDYAEYMKTVPMFFPGSRRN